MRLWSCCGDVSLSRSGLIEALRNRASSFTFRCVDIMEGVRSAAPMEAGPDPDGSGRTLAGGAPVLTTLFDLPPTERYSYVFEGNSQVLDQIPRETLDPGARAEMTSFTSTPSSPIRRRTTTRASCASPSSPAAAEQRHRSSRES